MSEADPIAAVLAGARSWTVLQADASVTPWPLPDRSVNCILTSPPYWGLRDYGCEGQIGLERTPEEYVARMVAVFREARRVLRDDGVLWLNLGDSYAANGCSGLHIKGNTSTLVGSANAAHAAQRKEVPPGLKPKDLVGIPWMVAFALRADGWYLRSDVIWHKPRVMPESVIDRPTKAHEYLFLLTKSGRYWYDADAIAEKAVEAGKTVRNNGNDGMTYGYDGNRTREGLRRGIAVAETRNARSVWSISPEPYPGAHFATMPTALAERCILAGCPKDGVVLDPFVGAGTTLYVAENLGRRSVGFELNPQSIALATARLAAGRRAFVAPSEAKGDLL